QISNTGGEVGAAFLSQLAKFPSIFGAGDARAAFSKAAGVSLNPFREVIFESVDPRTFTFKYKFLPKSKTETNMVRDIINLFKYHMYPDISENKLFFIYPSEFEIKYLFRGTENEYLHTFARCALESMDVSYGGEQFSSFRDCAPTEVNMSLTFRELEVLTKQSSQIKPKYRNVIPTVTSESDGVITTTRGESTRIADNR
ncbi:MAG: baseplate tail-tube junction protein, partial [Minisyncoccia bacterium]